MSKLGKLKSGLMRPYPGFGLCFLCLILPFHLIPPHLPHDGALVSVQSFGNGPEGISLLEENTDLVTFALRQASELFL